MFRIFRGRIKFLPAHIIFNYIYISTPLGDNKYKFGIKSVANYDRETLNEGIFFSFINKWFWYNSKDGLVECHQDQIHCFAKLVTLHGLDENRVVFKGERNVNSVWERKKCHTKLHDFGFGYVEDVEEWFMAYLTYVTELENTK